MLMTIYDTLAKYDLYEQVQCDIAAACIGAEAMARLLLSRWLRLRIKVPIEVQRRWSAAMPALSQLERLGECGKDEITRRAFLQTPDQRQMLIWLYVLERRHRRPRYYLDQADKEVRRDFLRFCREFDAGMARDPGPCVEDSLKIFPAIHNLALDPKRCPKLAAYISAHESDFTQALKALKCRDTRVQHRKREELSDAGLVLYAFLIAAAARYGAGGISLIKARLSRRLDSRINSGRVTFGLLEDFMQNRESQKKIGPARIKRLGELRDRLLELRTLDPRARHETLLSMGYEDEFVLGRGVIWLDETRNARAFADATAESAPESENSAQAKTAPDHAERLRLLDELDRMLANFKREGNFEEYGAVYDALHTGALVAPDVSSLSNSRIRTVAFNAAVRILKKLGIRVS